MRITLPALAAVLCAACGGGGGQHDNPDSSPGSPDAATDASPDARAIGSINVFAKSRCCDVPWGSPAPGVTVHVIAPGGELAATATTDAGGFATFDAVVAGSAVMVIYPPTAVNPVTVTTVLGVEPNDELVFGDSFYTVPVDTSTGGQFTLDFPPIAASWVALYLPCSGSVVQPSPPQMPYLYTACQSTNATVPALALDASNKVVASAVLRDIDLAIGASYTIDAWTPALARGVTATIPTTVPEANLELDWRYPTSLVPAREAAAITGGVASASFSAPDGSDGVAATAYLYRDGLGEQVHSRNFAPDVASVDVPIADLPWLAAPELSIADQRVRWNQNGTGGDAVFVKLSYEHADGTGYVDWTLIAPPGTGELSWADFPAEVPAPRGTDLNKGGTNVLISDLPTATSYNELRAAPEWQIRCPACSVERGELPAGAQVAADGSSLEN